MAEDDMEPVEGKPARKKYRDQLEEVKAELLKMGEMALETVRITREIMF